MPNSKLRFKLIPLLALFAAPAKPQELLIKVYDEEGNKLLPCRIHLRDSNSKAVRPPNLPFFHDHFVCPGKACIKLKPGLYRYWIERGPEYRRINGEVRILAGRRTERSFKLKRIADLRKDGWWSGEFHVHRPPEQMKLLMEAEDLHFACVITWWNGRGPWKENSMPQNTVVRFGQDYLCNIFAQEDERLGGALLFFNLPSKLPLPGSRALYPPSVHFLKQAKKLSGKEGPVWADIEKPFWWETPVWLATQLVDSVGICHNHMHRGGVLDSEAWGRKRDRGKYPPAWGNGLWT